MNINPDPTPGATLFDPAQCPVAAMGHHNVRGAQAYTDAITRELETEGVASFRESWDRLLASMAQKAGAVVAAPT